MKSLKNITIKTGHNTQFESYRGKVWAEASDKGGFIASANGDSVKEAIRLLENKLKTLGYK